jgi:hypothetical protein
MKDHIKLLIKVRNEIQPIKKKGSNPHFKSQYATLEDVIEAVTEPLQNNGFFLSHICGKDEFGAYVSTELFHDTGFTLQTKVPVVLSKQDMQGLGSAITYARRYGILSILNLPTEDDDGNDASRKVSDSASKSRAAGNIKHIDF